MNRARFGSLAALVLLFPSLALAQSDQPKIANEDATGRPDPPRGMYEDIEIMRRLVSEKLTGFSAATKIRALVAANATCIRCHQSASVTGTTVRGIPVYTNTVTFDPKEIYTEFFLPNANPLQSLNSSY